MHNKHPNILKYFFNTASSKRSSASGLELNRRGVPARKRKKNSLIYGTDDLVSIPVRSPKKRGTRSDANESG